jgi:hypothetical protein
VVQAEKRYGEVYSGKYKDKPCIVKLANEHAGTSQHTKQGLSKVKQMGTSLLGEMV